MDFSAEQIERIKKIGSKPDNHAVTKAASPRNVDEQNFEWGLWVIGIIFSLLPPAVSLASEILWNGTDEGIFQYFFLLFSDKEVLPVGSALLISSIVTVLKRGSLGRKGKLRFMISIFVLSLSFVFYVMYNLFDIAEKTLSSNAEVFSIVLVVFCLMVSFVQERG